MRQDYDSIESEFAATIAAAAFAVHSIEEETRANYRRKMIESFKGVPPTKAKSRKEDMIVPPNSRRLLSRKSSARDARDSGRSLRSYLTRPIEVEGEQKTKRRGLESSKAETWEKAQLVKISKWYEKTNSKILGWENEKKKEANVLKQKREAELERLRKEISLHHKYKLEWIDNVAGGARTQLEEKRRYEESKILKKAEGIRTTGRSPPVNCFCFEYYR